jgi:hypothetical protein
VMFERETHTPEAMIANTVMRRNHAKVHAARRRRRWRL